MKTLEEFDFTQSPHIPASRIRALAEGFKLPGAAAFKEWRLLQLPGRTYSRYSPR